MAHCGGTGPRSGSRCSCSLLGGRSPAGQRACCERDVVKPGGSSPLHFSGPLFECGCGSVCGGATLCGVSCVRRLMCAGCCYCDTGRDGTSRIPRTPTHDVFCQFVKWQVGRTRVSIQTEPLTNSRVTIDVEIWEGMACQQDQEGKLQSDSRIVQGVSTSRRVVRCVHSRLRIPLACHWVRCPMSFALVSF